MLRSLVAGVDRGKRGEERGGRGRGRLRGGLSDDGTFPIAFRSACTPPPPPPPPPGSPLPCLAPPHFPLNTHALDWQCLYHARLTAVGEVVRDAGMPQQLTVGCCEGRPACHLLEFL